MKTEEKEEGEKAWKAPQETSEEQEICLITFPDSIRTHDAMTLMLVMVVMAIAVGMATATSMATIKKPRRRDKKIGANGMCTRACGRSWYRFRFYFASIANVFNNHGVRAELGAYLHGNCFDFEHTVRQIHTHPLSVLSAQYTGHICGLVARAHTHLMACSI